jgi:tuftelin-interacting protein 11
VVDDINIQAKQLASSYEASLEPLAPSFDKLLGQFPKEFEQYRLDEIVVAAIAPMVSTYLTFVFFVQPLFRAAACWLHGSH